MAGTAGTHESPEARALRRWKEGHQAFHVYLVTIVTVLADAARAAEADDRDVLSRALCRLVVLYDATTATMQYTVDFPLPLYESTIRPSMAPPFLSEGFSGKLNTEHRLMVSRLKALSRRIATEYGRDPDDWPPEIAGPWSDLRRAKAENLSRHELICNRFVPGGESLLRQHLTR